MSKWVEYSEHGARPLVKAYSRQQARELFKDFREIKIDIEQLLRSELPAVGRFIPEGVFDSTKKERRVESHNHCQKVTPKHTSATLRFLNARLFSKMSRPLTSAALRQASRDPTMRSL